MNEVLMSWRDFSVNAELAAAERIVRKSVRLEKTRGKKNEEAMEAVSNALGLSARKVRGLFYGEVFHVAADEYRRLLSRWWMFVDRYTAEVHAMNVQMDREAEEEWAKQHQLSLDLPDPQSPSSAPHGASGARMSQRDVGISFGRK